jgi:hypothetical protein
MPHFSVLRRGALPRVLFVATAATLEYTTAELAAGDCLFLPSFWCAVRVVLG